ncbi:unnamed protein product [Paramecium sonneborni]|uniref:Transmembrane protein n=1 Tax=Paramecium sonneborni TaxID=65129 RepID=A0A8S1N7D8_9CILI|nr:unnamed protein product [Paramecium sonneborni]
MKLKLDLEDNQKMEIKQPGIQLPLELFHSMLNKMNQYMLFQVVLLELDYQLIHLLLVMIILQDVFQDFLNNYLNSIENQKSIIIQWSLQLVHNNKMVKLKRLLKFNKTKC